MSYKGMQPETESPGTGTSKIFVFIKKKRTLATWQIALIALLTALMGTASGGDSVDPSEVASLNSKLKAAEARAVSAEFRADNAVAEARNGLEQEFASKTSTLEQEFASRTSQLDQRTQTLDAEEATLEEREKGVSSAEAAAKANTFGDGVWEVNVDIQPGKYKTEGGGDCYWAKLKENDDIINNDIPGGPTTVTIERTVFKFQSKRCGEWHKAG